MTTISSSLHKFVNKTAPAMEHWLKALAGHLSKSGAVVGSFKKKDFQVIAPGSSLNEGASALAPYYEESLVSYECQLLMPSARIKLELIADLYEGSDFPIDHELHIVFNAYHLMGGTWYPVELSEYLANIHKSDIYEDGDFSRSADLALKDLKKQDVSAFSASLLFLQKHERV